MRRNEQVNIVIIGGGIVGCSIAYHLSQLGERDIWVLDKGPLFDNDGSSSHAPGILGLVTGEPTLTHWAQYSANLYADLGCFQRVGGMDIALTVTTEQALKRRHGLALARGLPARYIDRDEREALFPHINHQHIKATLLHEHDGMTNGPTVCAALADRCGDAVTFLANTAVAQLQVNKNRITGVTTQDGTQIQAERVVLASNIWGATLAEQVGITVPMLAAQHQYVVTEPLPLLHEETADVRMPNLRYFDYGIYVRQHHQAYGFGSYHHAPRMVKANDVGRTAIKPFTPTDFDAAWMLMQEQLPACAERSFERSFNGMFGFTIDDQPILGETPAVRGLWLALGSWVTHAGGVGQTLAQWMVNGVPNCDTYFADANRFHDHQKTAHFIHMRSGSHYQQHLQVVHPKEPWGEPRNIRQAPYHAQMVKLGAAFDEFAGWEMAQWYEANAPLLEKYREQMPNRDEWGGRHWSPISAAEHLATRSAAGLFNINGLTRIEVSGSDATKFLEWMCANRVDKPVGKITYTTLLNKQGKIVADLIVVRQEADRYLLITSTLHGQHDLAWLRFHQQGDVQIADVSKTWTGVAVWGPKAREVLRPLTQTNLNDAVFPYYTFQHIQLDHLPTLALNMSFVGEAGFELHVPVEYGAALWDLVWEAGRPHGLVPVGSVALDSLSKEKGYLIYGHDINGDYTPYEAGLGWAVKKNGEFNGRSALIQQKKDGVKKRRCTLTFNTPDGFALGSEPVLAGNKCVGHVTSANGGYAVGQHIAYAYLPIQYCRIGTQLQVEYLGKRYDVTVAKQPLL
ncbi:MAG: FAD-dependent oxidoreductase [Chloroflexota bacterium]